MIFTLGHSNLDVEALLVRLRAHRIEILIDVRRVPRSRRHPWFASEPLAGTLRDAGIAYHHLPELGGMRQPTGDETNAGVREPAFRGYADHMGSPEFARGVERLLALARTVRTALMCAEAEPDLCHRSYLADALVARGIEVTHALDDRKVRRHVLRTGARVVGGRVTYPATQGSLPFDPMG